MIRRILRRILNRPAPPPPSSAPRPPPEPEEPEPEIEVEGSEIAAWRQQGRSVHFLDIREPHEIQIGHIAGATLIPMNDVPDRLSEIPRGETLVVYCAAGARSFGVTHYLREQGYADAWSLVGGIGAWIEQDRAAWLPPPSGARFPPTRRARLTEAAAARLNRAALQPRAGTIQEVRPGEGGPRYVLGIPLPQGGIERLEGLSEADLEA